MKQVSTDPWTWFVALDGGDLDGLGGTAGLLRFAWPSKKVDHRMYDGISGGHNVSIRPDGKALLLGNLSQQLVAIDTGNLAVINRKTTMQVEEIDYRLRANTHHIWEDNDSFIGAIGDHLYRVRWASLVDRSNDRLDFEQLGAHRLWTPHELRWTKDKRFILMGDLGPENSGARQVGIFDMTTKEPTVMRLPGTVWHVQVHPELPIGYAATYTFATEDDDYVNWSPSYAREYIFEIDLEKKEVTRVWSFGAEYPIHLNSDLELYVRDAEVKLYVASGGSHTVVEVDIVDTLAKPRVAFVVPGFWRRLWNWRFVWRQFKRNLLGAFMRQSPFTGLNFVLQTYQISGKRFFDGIYCTRVSPDGTLVVAGARGYNFLRVMKRSDFSTVHHHQLDTLDNGLHLGLHHSEMVAREIKGEVTP